MSCRFMAVDRVTDRPRYNQGRRQEKLMQEMQNKLNQVNDWYQNETTQLKRLNLENQALKDRIEQNEAKNVTLNSDLRQIQTNTQRINARYAALEKRYQGFKTEIFESVNQLENQLGQRLEEIDLAFSEALKSTQKDLETTLNSLDLQRQEDVVLLQNQIQLANQALHDYKTREKQKVTQIQAKADLILAIAREMLSELDPILLQKSGLEERFQSIRQRISRAEAHQEAEQTRLGTAEEVFNKTVDIQRDLNSRVSEMEACKANLEEKIHNILHIVDHQAVRRYYTNELAALEAGLQEQAGKIQAIDSYFHYSTESKLIEQKLEDLLTQATHIRSEAPITHLRFEERVNKVDELLLDMAHQSWSGSGDYELLSSRYAVEGDLKSDWQVIAKISGIEIEITRSLDPTVEFGARIVSDHGPGLLDEMQQSTAYEMKNRHATQVGFKAVQTNSMMHNYAALGAYSQAPHQRNQGMKTYE